MNMPLAVHIGNHDLPFVDIGDGSQLKVLQVKPDEGIWVIENIFHAGYEVETHRLRAQCTHCSVLRTTRGSGST